MTARDAISPVMLPAPGTISRRVEGDLPLVDVLPRLLDSPDRLLEVTEGDIPVGVIDQTSMLTALGLMLAARDDSSVITVECRPEDYSASLLAHAVEDAGVHLVDLWSVPSAEGRVRVTLRVRCVDPSPVIRSLERYDYNVVEAHGLEYADAEISAQRLTELRAFLQI